MSDDSLAMTRMRHAFHAGGKCECADCTPDRVRDIYDAIQVAVIEAYLYDEGASSHDWAAKSYADAVDAFCRAALPDAQRKRLHAALCDCARLLRLPELHPDAWTHFVLCPECHEEMGDHSALGCPVDTRKPYEPPRLVELGSDDPRVVVMMAELDP